MLYNKNSQPIAAAVRALEGKDWIIELENNEE